MANVEKKEDEADVIRLSLRERLACGAATFGGVLLTTVEFIYLPKGPMWATLDLTVVIITFGASFVAFTGAMGGIVPGTEKKEKESSKQTLTQLQEDKNKVAEPGTEKKSCVAALRDRASCFSNRTKIKTA